MEIYILVLKGLEFERLGSTLWLPWALSILNIELGVPSWSLFFFFFFPVEWRCKNNVNFLPYIFGFQTLSLFQTEFVLLQKHFNTLSLKSIIIFAPNLGSLCASESINCTLLHQRIFSATSYSLFHLILWFPWKCNHNFRTKTQSQFQNKMAKSMTHFQTKTLHKTSHCGMGWYIPI